MVVRPCDSPFVPLPARESLLMRRSGAASKLPPSACFSTLARVFAAAHGSLSRNRVQSIEVGGAMVDPKGHQASSPWQMPRAAWKDIALRTYKRVWDDNVGLVAAGVAFYGFFALLSLLGLVVLAYGIAADPFTVIEHVHALTGVLPTDVAFIIGDQLMNAVRASQQAKGPGIAIAFLVGTYGGTNGATSVLTALMIAYEEKEKRSLLHYYLLAVCLTFGAVLLALAAIAGTAALAFLQHLLPAAAPGMVIAGKIVGYLLLTLVAAAVASFLYRFGPSREDAQWEWIRSEEHTS